ncbi:MAG TPA: hypothetical protein VGO26_05960 [Amnibacterium sp.]|nr:hypothetical protein [Amnibacterium sp.]
MSLNHQDFAAATWEQRERAVRERHRNRDYTAERRPSALRRFVGVMGRALRPTPAPVLPAAPLPPIVSGSAGLIPVVGDLVAPAVELVRPVVDEVVAAVQAPTEAPTPVQAA